MVRKYSYEFKKFIVTVLENGIMSASELSRRLKIHKGVICRIYNKYKCLGDEGLKYTYTRKKYTIEFKIKVLKYKLENNLTYEQASLHFNIPLSTVIYDWNKFCSKFIGDNMSDKNILNIKKSKHSNSTDIKVTKSEYSEEVRQLKERISELEKELYYQSAETAYLKKLEALMQSKEQRVQLKIITALRLYYSLDILLSVSNMKRSTYYYNITRLSKIDKYASAKTAILEIYEKSNKTYGYPRISKALEKLGYTYDRKTVYKLMKELKISSIIRIKRRYKRGKLSCICEN